MKKTELEKEMDELLIEYSERFGVTYPLYLEDDRPWEFHILRIKKALETGKPCPETILPANCFR